MVKALGVVFVAIILAVPVFAIDHIHATRFLYTFFQGQSIGIAATVLALNLATVTFLLGHLVVLESKANKELFAGTRSELRDNVYFMFALFILLLGLATLMRPSTVISIEGSTYNPIVFISIVVFMLIFACLFEVIQTVFRATKFLGESKK